ncbi:MAG: Hemolysin-type calcium-binding protein [Rhodospirillaceae bacterium]|nr:MAG: Hemolysin-type calcium-binding protein [Rhodospirillaceae bacterium]
MIARDGARIDIYNNSPFTLRVNDAVIRDSTVVRPVNGQLTSFAAGKVYLNDTSLSGGGAGAAAGSTIKIIQDSLPASFYGLDGSVSAFSGPQDLYLAGSVVNENGSLIVKNVEGSVNVTGELRAGTVDIFAAGDFNLNVEGWQHIQDPRQYIDYTLMRSKVWNTDGTSKKLELAKLDDAPALKAGINKNSRIIAQGDVNITARYLNINGTVQSGISELELNIDETFAPTGSVTFLDQTAAGLTQSVSDLKKAPTIAVKGVDFGTVDVPVDGYFDAAKQAIVIEKLNPKAGRITLAGQMLSTGNGHLKVADGNPHIEITNKTAYDLILEGIDASSERAGRITIIDTKTLRKEEYTVQGASTTVTEDGTTLTMIRYTQQGSATNHALSAAVAYQPIKGQYYVWTEGQEKTQVEIRKYEKNSFNLIGFDWDFLVADDSYVSKKVEYRDQKPLLESETLQMAGTSGMPAYAVGDVYTISYEQKRDLSVNVVKNTTQVHDITTHKMYKYIGDTAQLILPDADTAGLTVTKTSLTDTKKWSYVKTLTTTEAKDWEDS